MPYYNYLGQPMPESAAPATATYGTSAGDETLTAQAGASALNGQGGGDSLVGSSGDTTFFIVSAKDQVLELSLIHI